METEELIETEEELWHEANQVHANLLLKVKYVGLLLYKEENEIDLNRQLDKVETILKQLREKINNFYKEKKS